MWDLCEWCYDNPRGWDAYDSGYLIGTVSVPACGDGCCSIREECEECHGTGLQFHPDFKP